MNLDLSDIPGGCLKLTIDIGYADHVIIDEGQVLDARADQGFGAPTAHAAHAEKDDAGASQLIHDRPAQQQLGTMKEGGSHGVGSLKQKSREDF